MEKKRGSKGGAATAADAATSCSLSQGKPSHKTKESKSAKPFSTTFAGLNPQEVHTLLQYGRRKEASVFLRRMSTKDGSFFKTAYYAGEVGTMTWKFYISSHLTQVLGTTHLAGREFSTELPYLPSSGFRETKGLCKSRRDQYIPQDSPDWLLVQGLEGCGPESCLTIICTLPNSLTASISFNAYKRIAQ